MVLLIIWLLLHNWWQHFFSSLIKKITKEDDAQQFKVFFAEFFIFRKNIFCHIATPQVRCDTPSSVKQKIIQDFATLLPPHQLSSKQIISMTFEAFGIFKSLQNKDIFLGFLGTPREFLKRRKSHFQIFRNLPFRKSLK